MEIDGEEPAAREAARVGMTQAILPGPERTENYDQHRDAKNAIIKFAYPAKYNGKSKPEVFDKFIHDLQVYLRITTGSEEDKVLLASLFLDGDAREWWDLKCAGHLLPPDIKTTQDFLAAIQERFASRTTQDRAFERLINLRQGKLPLGHYLEKFKALATRSRLMDEQLLYRWLVRGLTGEMRVIATNWATAEVGANRVASASGLLEYLQRYAARDISDPVYYDTATNELDGEPMDIGAVATKGPVAAKHDARDGAEAAKGTRPFRQGSTRKVCFFCYKPGHIRAMCRHCRRVYP